MIEITRLRAAVIALRLTYTEVNKAAMEYFMSAKEDDVSSTWIKAFRALRDINENMEEANKPIKELVEGIKKKYLPEAFEREEIKTLTADTGDRTTVNEKMFASIIAEKRPQAFQWLRDNGYGDIIQETVNASTLSAFAKTLLETENKELPEEFFRVHAESQATLTRGKVDPFA